MAHHYDVAGTALLQALERGLGDEWSERLERAWAHAYALAAGTMRDAADSSALEA